MKLKVTKDLCEIKENEVWNVGDYNVHTVQVELSPEFNGLVNKVRYFVEDNSYDMLITDNVAQVPYEATVMEGTIKIGVYGYDADTDILVQSTSPVNKYITSGTYTGDPDNTQPLTPTDKEQMETAIQKNTNDITDLKANKQDKLISGVNIKTINNESILSGGNLTLVTEETDPIFTNSPAYSITDNDITYWNNKANMSDIPDVSNFITKDVDNLTYYTKSTDMQTAINNAVGNERTARENADNSLQNQIDAITVSSDVVDVVSTYQDLVDYDTQHIKANDIIKVMQDSTHDNAISYYRWVIVNHVGSWEYVGSEGPYYTKSETDTLINAKQNTLVSGQNIKTINNESLLGEGNINIQSGGTSNYTDLTNKPKINNVELKGNKSLNDLGIQPVGNYALESDMIEAQNDIDHLSKISNLFEKITGTGTNITLNDTSDTIMKLNLDTTTSSQENVPTPSSPQTIHTITGNNEIKISNKNLIASVQRNGNSLFFNGTNSQTEYIFKAGTYTLSFVNENVTSVYIKTPSTNATSLGSNSPKTFTSDEDFNIWIYRSGMTSDETTNIQLEEGSIATEYVTHKEQTYPINLGDIELCKVGNYKDVIFKNTMDSAYYDSSLELNKWYKLNRIGKKVLNGSEGWYKFALTYSSSQYLFRAAIDNLKKMPNSVAYILSDNFKNRTYYEINNSGLEGVCNLNNYSICCISARQFDDYTKEQFETWLSNNNTTIYYPLETPTYTLLNNTLQTQLDSIQYALAYDTQTNISQTNTDLPFIIDAETYVDLTDYVKNTDYATSSKGGVVKTGYGSNVDSNGNLYASNISYANYQTAGNNDFISKGTLENVITGKNLETANNKVTSISSSSTDVQYPSAKCVHDSQATQDDEIEALQTENERLKATLPTTTVEGQDITLDKTAEMEFVKPPLPRGNSEQNGEPSPDNEVPITNVTGNVEVTISNENNTESKTLPLSLGNIELCEIGNYQDYIYKNEGNWYVHNAINKLVLNGSENWNVSSYWEKTNTNVYYATTKNDIYFPDWTSNYCLSNYFITYARNPLFSLDDNGLGFSGTAGITSPSFTIRIDKTLASDAQNFKTWLSTHNTIIYYVLATPTDTEITDTTLISQLEEISKVLSYQGQTNITSNTIALFNVEAYQSTKLILENLDSRLTLVEG